MIMGCPMNLLTKWLLDSNARDEIERETPHLLKSYLGRWETMMDSHAIVEKNSLRQLWWLDCIPLGVPNFVHF